MKNLNFLLSFLFLIYAIPSANANQYPKEVVKAIYLALDDEYKAYSTYRAYLNHFGNIRPFVNIIESEKNHIESLKNILKKEQIIIPDNPYNVEEIAVPKNIKEACKIGIEAEIENKNLYYNELLPVVKSFDDVSFVFKRLAKASEENHLAAFKRCASRR